VSSELSYYLQDIGKLKPHLIQDNGHARDVYMFGLLVDQFSEQIRFSSHVDQVTIAFFTESGTSV